MWSTRGRSVPTMSFVSLTVVATLTASTAPVLATGDPGGAGALLRAPIVPAMPIVPEAASWADAAIVPEATRRPGSASGSGLVSGSGSASGPAATNRSELDSGPGAGGFRSPLPGVPVPVRHFAPPPAPWLAGHRGVDLVAAPEIIVRAAGAGTVLFAGMVAGRPVVSLGHDAGLRTTYEPVRPMVTTGSRVTVGEPLGVLLAGHPGCPAPACLHWGLRRGETYLDPLALLGLVRVRLLPVGAAPTLPAMLAPPTVSARLPGASTLLAGGVGAVGGGG